VPITGYNFLLGANILIAYSFIQIIWPKFNFGADVTISDKLKCIESSIAEALRHSAIDVYCLPSSSSTSQKHCL